MSKKTITTNIDIDFLSCWIDIRFMNPEDENEFGSGYNFKSLSDEKIEGILEDIRQAFKESRSKIV